ncbi:MAG: DUF6531 domain-containing protein [Pseudomonas sp.]|uniref:DUF6531 domain-containing protein n=1 Tax=Pseudomonas sp. TaxID=306 RepID=UPI0030F171F5
MDRYLHMINAGRALAYSRYPMRVLFFAFLISLTQNSLAATYKWAVSATEAASPAAACKAYVDWSTAYNGVYTGGWKYVYKGVTRKTDILFDCIFERSIYGYDSPTITFIYADNRSGESCQPGASYNSETGECLTPKGPELGAPQTQACSAQPISLVSGNNFLSVTDYTAPIGGTLVFGLEYNSLDGVWRHNYSTRLNISNNTIVRVAKDGFESSYTVNSGIVSGNASDLGTLTAQANNWIYTSIDNDVYIFNANGQLTKQISGTGQQQEISYSGNSMTVTDNFGQSLTITEDAQHQPLTLTTPGVNIQYSYDSTQRLIQVIRTQGGQTAQRQYHYEDIRNNALLTAITDERGVRARSWAYDDQGRTISSQHAGGIGLTQVSYNSDGTRKVTN